MNAKEKRQIRFGLCCQFHDAPISFRTTTAKALSTAQKPLEKVSSLILENCHALLAAIQFCHQHGIGAFRVNSQFFPVYTHPEQGYTLDQLPQREAILQQLQACRALAADCKIRLVFHPDQFVVLNSPSEKVVASSIQELEYHGLLAEALGADVINIHGGGVYGDKNEALMRFQHNFKRLSDRVQTRLTVENDDRSYTPSDLLPLCTSLGIPLVYDVHHHRCLTDDMSIEEASRKAYATWNREPLFHISSPKNGWTSGQEARSHHDYIDIHDFPRDWLHIGPLTLEVEAKAKELAVLQLVRAVQKI